MSLEGTTIGGGVGMTGGEPGWMVVAKQGLVDLWMSGRALILLIGFSLFMTVFTVLMATSPDINLLTQKALVGLTLQVIIIVGILLVLIVSADTFSGKRDRSTLESLILTPVPRRHFAIGNFVTAFTLWIGVLLVAVPYILVPTKGTGLFAESVALVFVVGTILVVIFSFLAMTISTFAPSNLVSFGLNLFVFFALTAPTQLPSNLRAGSFGKLLVRTDPTSAGMDFMSSILVDGGTWTQELSLLTSPVIVMLLMAGIGLFTIDRYLNLFGRRSV